MQPAAEVLLDLAIAPAMPMPQPALATAAMSV